MKILGFDTSLNKTYLSLDIDGNLSFEVIESTEEKYHSAFLIKKIVQILEKNNLTSNDIDLIVTNIGPGSFTGIRVGLTVARAFAQGIKCKTIGVNSLELISRAYGEGSIVVLDARKNKVYVGNNESVDLLELEKLPELLEKYPRKVVADTRMEEFLTENKISAINFEKDEKNYCKVLIEIAKEKFKMGYATNWEGLKPLYIQPPPIHQNKK